jgi:hypothetical protein
MRSLRPISAAFSFASSAQRSTASLLRKETSSTLWVFYEPESPFSTCARLLKAPSSTRPFTGRWLDTATPTANIYPRGGRGESFRTLHVSNVSWLTAKPRLMQCGQLHLATSSCRPPSRNLCNVTHVACSTVGHEKKATAICFF